MSIKQQLRKRIPLAGGWLGTIKSLSIAVSYTHLDVYKRQVLGVLVNLKA